MHNYTSYQRFHKTILVLGAVLIYLLISGCVPLTIETDVEQSRLDTPAPLLNGKRTVGQTFFAQHPNLNSVTLLSAVYDKTAQIGDEPHYLTFHLRANSIDAEDVITLPVDVSRLEHNTPLRLSFPPQQDSANRLYYFFLEGSKGNVSSVWYTATDAYGRGTMYLDGQAAEGDLHFTTSYEYDLNLLIDDLRYTLKMYWWLAFPLLALLFLPGHLLLVILSRNQILNPLTYLALSFGVSVALIPVALLWTSTLGVRLSRPVVFGIVAVLIGQALWHLYYTRGSGLRRFFSKPSYLFMGSLWAMILALILALRFIHIRSVVLPVWVDSVHHTLITQLIATEGRVPDSYRPLIAVDNFYYHYGFHAVAAFFQWLTGLDSPRAVLILGQILNAGAALVAYSFVTRLVRHTNAIEDKVGQNLSGLWGVMVVGLISIMPAYYVSWGRYTQLTGLILLPIAIVLTLDALETRQRSWRHLLLAAIVLAGLFLTHYRVTVFTFCFFVPYLIYESVVGWSNRKIVYERWLRISIVGGLAILLTLPWIINLATNTVLPLSTFPTRIQGAPSYNVAPVEFILAGHNWLLIGLSAMGAVWGVWRRERGIILCLLWVAALFLAVNPNWFGLPTTWLLNNATVIITLFLPFAVLSGYFVNSFYQVVYKRLAGKQRPVWQALTGALLLAVVLWSARGLINVINPITILATEDDMTAMRWIEKNTPANAVFLINTRYWQGNIYVGSDGGWWIPVLTGRDTILPAIPYAYGSPAYREQINDLAGMAADIVSLDDPTLHALLKERGVTHLYVGAKGGSITPRIALASPSWQPVYSNGAVWIFALNERKGVNVPVYANNSAGY